ncbi:MAG: hypothetical protein ABEJ05_08450 [Haloglomus sp.]
MRRRQVLATLAAATSGCTGLGGDPTAESAGGTTPSGTPRTAPERTTSESDTPTPPAPPRSREIAAVDREDGPIRETFGVAADLSLPDDTVAGADAAQVELALRTVADEEQALTYEQTHCGRNEFRATTDEFGLYLFPAEGEWTRDELDCPVVSRPNLACGIPVVEETVIVPASEPLTWRYDVVVPPGNRERGGCVVPGRYRFARAFTHEGTSATLSFALSVSVP